MAWFPFALAYKFGNQDDTSSLKRWLRFVNPEKIKPDPRPVLLNKVALTTTADLYAEVKAKLQEAKVEEDCSTELLMPNFAPSLE